MLQRLIVVDRERFRLDIFNWKLAKRRYVHEAQYPITVGKEGNETPHGLYFVQRKTRRPDWKIPPNPDYDESTWGNILKFGEPGNPFAGGFISLGGKEFGIGIHGTSFDPKVGTASSHGCVRMLTEDLLAIYDRCKVNTPVYLH